jgi:hypothetical protein
LEGGQNKREGGKGGAGLGIWALKPLVLPSTLSMALFGASAPPQGGTAGVGWSPAEKGWRRCLPGAEEGKRAFPPIVRSIQSVAGAGSPTKCPPWTSQPPDPAPFPFDRSAGGPHRLFAHPGPAGEPQHLCEFWRGRGRPGSPPWTSQPRDPPPFPFDRSAGGPHRLFAHPGPFSGLVHFSEGGGGMPPTPDQFCSLLQVCARAGHPPFSVPPSPRSWPALGRVAPSLPLAPPPTLDHFQARRG